jgi:hypothetical protein
MVCPCDSGRLFSLCLGLGETFGFVRDLILRLKNERHGDGVRAIRSDNGSEFKTLISKPFVVIWVSNISFFSLCGLSEWCG